MPCVFPLRQIADLYRDAAAQYNETVGAKKPLKGESPAR